MRRTPLAGLLAGAAAAAGCRLRGGPYLLQRSQVVPAPLDAVFRFFEDPYNLSRITPPWVRFEVLRVEKLPLRQGVTNEYRIRWLGLPLRWRSLIVDYQPGQRFTDVQTSGPYRSWRHEHAFEAVEDATRVGDRVAYELPLGPLGRLVHALVVRRQLREIFAYRAAQIDEIFGEG